MLILCAVKSVKFVEQKKWFIVASDDDFIHVYNYERELHKITSFRGGSIVAVHPSKPYMLSASSRRVELWCWYKDWECAQILFEIDHCATPSQVVFNPTDTDTYAIAFKEHTVVEVCILLPSFFCTIHISRVLHFEDIYVTLI
jgi:WD40 repeat protein